MNINIDWVPGRVVLSRHQFSLLQRKDAVWSSVHWLGTVLEHSADDPEQVLVQFTSRRVRLRYADHPLVIIMAVYILTFLRM